MDISMATVILLACGSLQRDSKQKAIDLYKGAPFCSNRNKIFSKYGEAIESGTAHLYIISTKHHLLMFDEEIYPYNFPVPSGDALGSWVDKIVDELENSQIPNIRPSYNLYSDNFIIYSSYPIFEAFKKNGRIQNLTKGI